MIAAGCLLLLSPPCHQGQQGSSLESTGIAFWTVRTFLGKRWSAF